MSPKPKTQDYIYKIAPAIRHNEHTYPKFVSRIKHIKIGADNNTSALSSIQSNPDKSLVQSQNQSLIFNSKQRKSESNHSLGGMKPKGKFVSVNQSVGFIAPISGDEQSQASSRLNQTVMEHTPQGEFPKFIKGYAKKRYTLKISQNQR